MLPIKIQQIVHSKLSIRMSQTKFMRNLHKLIIATFNNIKLNQNYAH